jgi:peptidoglycan DL-endopeptidase CwlO
MRLEKFSRVVGLILFAVLSFVPVRAEKVSVATIQPTDLIEYETEPEEVKRLIEVSLGLTRKKLGYRFGSNSPKKRGMDCSGTVQCSLVELGLGEVPRSSWNFYEWVEASGKLKPTPGVTTTEDPVFADLKPGDLLFWEGTYETGERLPAISHVMIYLGTLKEDGEGVVFGASSGRRYRGKTIHGVSVFDWDVPDGESKSRFVGFGPIPGLRRDEVEPAPLEKPNPLKTFLENLFKKSEASRP